MEQKEPRFIKQVYDNHALRASAGNGQLDVRYLVENGSDTNNDGALIENASIGEGYLEIPMQFIYWKLILIKFIGEIYLEIPV